MDSSLQTKWSLEAKPGLWEGWVASNMQASFSRKDLPHPHPQQQHSTLLGWHPRKPCGLWGTRPHGSL